VLGALGSGVTSLVNGIQVQHVALRPCWDVRERLQLLDHRLLLLDLHLQVLRLLVGRLRGLLYHVY